MSQVTALERPIAAIGFWTVLAAIGGVYTAQSLVGSFTFIGLPAVLRESGASLETIGFLSLLMLPWALKFLWAPALERFRQPSGQPRRSRFVVTIGQVTVAMALVGVAFCGPERLVPLIGLVAVMAIVSASVDIACDAFAIENLPERKRGWGNTAQVGGSYLGIVLGSGLFLVLVPLWGWLPAVLVLSALMLFLTAPFRFVPDEAPAPHRGKAGIPHPNLARAFRNPNVRIGLGVTVLFDLGMRFIQPMISPFLIDQGVSLEIIGVINGVGGVLAGLAGTALGGLAVHSLGVNRAVILAIVLQFSGISCIALGSYAEAETALMIVLMLTQGAIMAFGFVALYSKMMGLSSLHQAGVDFTLFQCADALIAGLAGAMAGTLAQAAGYTTCFALGATFSLAGLCLIPLLLKRVPTVEE